MARESASLAQARTKKSHEIPWMPCEDEEKLTVRMMSDRLYTMRDGLDLFFSFEERSPVFSTFAMQLKHFLMAG